MYKHSIVLGSVFNKYQVPSTMAPPQCVLVTQLCPTLCDLIVCSPPGSSLHGYWSGLPCHSAGDLPNQGCSECSHQLHDVPFIIPVLQIKNLKLLM